MEKKLTGNQKLVINMSANFIAYGVSLFISFFLSPYIVKTIGVEANGFVSLANNFVSYASLITLALNSLAGRFITISIVKGDKEEANRYFTSVFYANLIIGGILGILGLGIVFFLEQLIQIPKELVMDVRLLFICLFLNCILSIVGSVFSVATFARNKLYLESIRNIQTNIARAACIIALFVIFNPKVWYIGFATLISSMYLVFCNIRYTKELLPEIRIERTYFDKKAVIELISSGIWNTINRLGQIFTEGLDLLVTNLLIDSTAMGILALAKTIPSLISNLMGSIVGVFSPNFTILYAEEKYEELLVQIKQSMKIMGVMTNLPIIILIVCGDKFFQLWQPTQNAEQLQILSLLTIGCLIISGGINALYGVFTVVNKIKVNSIVVVSCGLLSTICTLIALKMSNLGIYAVAGVSTVVSIARNLVFTAPYGAKCLGQKWYTFYPDIFRPVFFVILSATIGKYISQFITGTSWFILLGECFVVGGVALSIGYFAILNSAERHLVLSKIRSIVKRR